MCKIWFLTVASLASALAAQPASYTYLPQPTGPQYPPQLTALTLPKVGTTLQLRVPATWYSGFRVTSPWGSSVLLTGATNPNLDLSALGVFGRLYSSAEIIVRTPGGFLAPTKVTMNLPIPNNPSLLGVTFWQQVYTVRQGKSGVYASLSGGGFGVAGT